MNIDKCWIRARHWPLWREPSLSGRVIRCAVSTCPCPGNGLIHYPGRPLTRYKFKSNSSAVSGSIFYCTLWSIRTKSNFGKYRNWTGCILYLSEFIDNNRGNNSTCLYYHSLLEKYSVFVVDFEHFLHYLNYITIAKPEAFILSNTKLTGSRPWENTNNWTCWFLSGCFWKQRYCFEYLVW